jgi:hypothetical protein
MIHSTQILDVTVREETTKIAGSIPTDSIGLTESSILRVVGIPETDRNATDHDLARGAE